MPYPPDLGAHSISQHTQSNALLDYADYKKWYHTKRWERLARHQLRAEPLCAMCLRLNVLTAARVADHIIPHKGNDVLFWTGQLQSLCHHHHSKSKHTLETKGYVDDIGADGWPMHPNHPANKQR